MTPEKIVQNAIVNYLKRLNSKGFKVIVKRRQAGGYSYSAGEADLYAIVYGRHLEIEVKAPGKSLRPMQEKWKEMCIKNEIDYICADSIDEFIAFFTQKYQCG